MSVLFVISVGLGFVEVYSFFILRTLIQYLCVFAFLHMVRDIGVDDLLAFEFVCPSAILFLVQIPLVTALSWAGRFLFL